VRTLIVDDNPMMAEDLKINMRYLGYDVDTVDDAMEAISKLKDKHYDIVITDGYMPRMTGFTLCRFIKSRFSSTFVIGVTGSINLHKFKDAGADAWFTKPFQFSKLQQAIEDLYLSEYASPVGGE
jgi:CheY-like chemotaxis protein